MKHKHYDKIVAKAANMDLVVFFNPSFGSGGSKWEEATTTLFPAFHPDTEYFLCLPQHKEACLHWLNGGELNVDNGKGLGVGRYTLSIKNNFPLSDFVNHHEYTFIIKPKKEKRLLAINGDQVSFANSLLCYPQETQFIEIEIEVEV